MAAEQILSQMEVDALLRGLSSGDIKTESEVAEAAEKGDRDMRVYDFSRQERVIRGRMPILDMINEKFSRNVRGSIFNIIRKTVDVSHDGVETMKYEEFLRNLHVPSSLNVFYITTLRGQGVLVIDPNLVFLIVDSYFGGDCRFHTRVEGKDFTNVEQVIVKKVVDAIYHDLTEVWKPVHPLEFKHKRTEMNPQFISIVGAKELVVVSSFKMEIESSNNVFYVCLPYSMIEPIKDKLFGTMQSEWSEVDRRWLESLKEQFDEVSLELSSEIGRARIHVSDLMNLKVGDIIQLDKKAKDPVDVRIEDLHKFYATAGVIDNNYALKIVGVK